MKAEVRSGQIVLGNDFEASEGAPACLTYHRLVGNYWANDAFLIRGHFEATGRLIPEKSSVTADLRMTEAWDL